MHSAFEKGFSFWETVDFAPEPHWATSVLQTPAVHEV